MIPVDKEAKTELRREIERVLLAKVHADIGQFVRQDPDGQMRIKPLDTIPRTDRLAIKSIGHNKVELHDKVAACEKLFKLYWIERDERLENVVKILVDILKAADVDGRHRFMQMLGEIIPR